MHRHPLYFSTAIYTMDTERVYTHLLTQWLEYMVHLKQSYPFLFSFSARTNPLRPDAQPEVV